MSKSVHSVQTYVLITYSDGLVARLQTLNTELEPLATFPQDVQVRHLVASHATHLMDHFAELGVDGLHAAASDAPPPPDKGETETLTA